jgi:hypothetical protein
MSNDLIDSQKQKKIEEVVRLIPFGRTLTKVNLLVLANLPPLVNTAILRGHGVKFQSSKTTSQIIANGHQL